MDKKYCHYYWAFEPLIGVLQDSPARTPAFEQEIQYNDKSYKLALFCTEENVPEFLRIVITDLNSEEIPEDILPFLQIVKEHMLTSLKIMYSSDLEIFPRPIWAFYKDGEAHNMSISVSYKNTDAVLDSTAVKNFFSNSLQFREEVRLLLDSSNQLIPMAYRYLSLYKILEREFKDSGDWQREKLDEHLQKYEPFFKKENLEGKPASVIHDMRDKCSHIQTGKKKKTKIGLTSMNHKELVKAHKIFPILQRICVDLVNEKADGAFVVGSKNMA